MDLLRPFKGGRAAAAAATTAPPPARASVDAGTIAYRFNWEWCFDPDNGAEGDTAWWWARSVRVDPNEVIADDGEGHLWSVPFSTDGTDAITWGDAQRVAETFTPVAASEGVVATAVVQRRRQRALASNLDRPERGRSASPPAAAESATNEEDRPMTDEQRRTLALSLGLAEDATETAIHETAASRAAEPPDQPETPVEVPASELEETPAETPEPVAASAHTDLRDLLGLPATASAEQIATEARRLRDNATAGAEQARRAQATELDGLADAAVRDGRIAPSARDAWRQAIDPTQNPTAAATAERERLASMATNRVPVTERGHVPDPAAAQAGGSLNRALAAAGVNRNGRSGATQEVTHRG